MNDKIEVTFLAADGKRCCIWCHSDWRLGGLAAHFADCPKSATYRVRQLSAS